MTEEERLIVDAATAAAGRVPVVLCGSRALGTADEHSDWDVLVVVPVARVPTLVKALARASERVTSELGVPVTINPLPRHALARARENLFVWKVAREGRVLAAPDGFALPVAGAPPVMTPERSFSYLASALLWLLEGSDAKAARHLAQLRLLRAGDYDSDPPLTGEPRAEVLAELDGVGCPYSRSAAIRRNVVYLALSALRGRSRLRAALSLRAIDCRLAEAAVALLRGGEPQLPPGVGRPAREAIMREWPSAHPLLSL